MLGFLVMIFCRYRPVEIDINEIDMSVLKHPGYTYRTQSIYLKCQINYAKIIFHQISYGNHSDVWVPHSYIDKKFLDIVSAWDYLLNEMKAFRFRANLWTMKN